MENLKSEREKVIWKAAKKRVAFRRQLLSYIIFNVFLWAIWFIGDNITEEHTSIWFAWPLWCTLGWGIGILYTYFEVFVFSRYNSIEKEFNKLNRSA